MIGLIQRVSEAKVTVDEQVTGQIEQGIVLLLSLIHISEPTRPY